MQAATHNPHNVFYTGNHAVGKADSDVKEVRYESGTVISYLSNNIFSTFQNLQLLRINNVQLSGTLERFSFRGSNNLFWLYAYSNQITNISADTFHDSKKLSSLYLYDNKIEYIEESTFSENLELTYLRLYSNSIKLVHKNAFVQNTKLQVCN